MQCVHRPVPDSLFGWWWADSVALVVAVLAVREGLRPGRDVESPFEVLEDLEDEDD